MKDLWVELYERRFSEFITKNGRNPKLEEYMEIGLLVDQDLIDVRAAQADPIYERRFE